MFKWGSSSCQTQRKCDPNNGEYFCMSCIRFVCGFFQLFTIAAANEKPTESHVAHEICFMPSFMYTGLCCVLCVRNRVKWECTFPFWVCVFFREMEKPTASCEGNFFQNYNRAVVWCWTFWKWWTVKGKSKPNAIRYFPVVFCIAPLLCAWGKLGTRSREGRKNINGFRLTPNRIW